MRVAISKGSDRKVVICTFNHDVDDISFVYKVTEAYFWHLERQNGHASC